MTRRRRSIEAIMDDVDSKHKPLEVRRIEQGLIHDAIEIRLRKLLCRMGWDKRFNDNRLQLLATGHPRVSTITNFEQLNHVSKKTLLDILDILCTKLDIDPYGDEDVAI